MHSKEAIFAQKIFCLREKKIKILVNFFFALRFYTIALPLFLFFSSYATYSCLTNNHSLASKASKARVTISAEVFLIFNARKRKKDKNKKCKMS